MHMPLTHIGHIAQPDGFLWGYTLRDLLCPAHGLARSPLPAVEAAARMQLGCAGVKDVIDASVSSSPLARWHKASGELS